MLLWIFYLFLCFVLRAVKPLDLSGVLRRKSRSRTWGRLRPQKNIFVTAYSQCSRYLALMENEASRSNSSKTDWLWDWDFWLFRISLRRYISCSKTHVSVVWWNRLLTISSTSMRSERQGMMSWAILSDSDWCRQRLQAMFMSWNFTEEEVNLSTGEWVKFASTAHICWGFR